MEATTAQFLFAAELVTFLAGAAGVALVLLRPELITDRAWSKGLLGLGFAGLALVSFARGAQLLGEKSDPALIALRVLAVAIITIGSLRWATAKVVRHVLWIGLAVILAAALAGRFDGGFGAESLLVVGGLAVGASLFSVSRRSIAARVAASSAGTLLLVVVVLSVALSRVLSNSVEREAVGRLDDVTVEKVAGVDTTVGDSLRQARLAAETLRVNRLDELRRVFVEKSKSAVIEADLKLISERYLSKVPLGYVTPFGTVVAAYKIDPVTLVALSGSRVLEEARSASAEQASIDVVSGSTASVLAVAAEPILDSGGQIIGVLVAAVPIDRDYLDSRSAANERLSPALSVATHDRVLSTFVTAGGTETAAPLVTSVAAEAIEKNRATRRVEDGRFVVARPILTADGRPVAAVVVSTATSLIEEGRRELFKTLFLIAMGGTLIALVLAALVGDRIGAAVRRLTVAAERIQRGDLSVRASISSDDEIGVLAGAFDSMVVSLEEKTSTETALRGRLEGVVAGMGEALIAVDAVGMITDFNQAAEELVGIAAAEARGRVVSDVLRVAGDDGGDLTERLRRPTPGRSSHTGVVDRYDATRVPVALTVGGLRDPDGELSGAVAVLRDLRREREVERMKTEFLSRVGHELRTPLTGIHGYADLLLRHDVSSPQARQFHSEILEQSVQLLRIVERLEFHAASAANRIMPRKEQLDVRSLLRDVAADKEEMAGRSRPLSVKVARGIKTVPADRRYLTMALGELLDNAVKFSPEGGRIDITASKAEDAPGFVEISVIDRGLGMTAEQVEQVFADFVQVDTSDTRRFGGLGAGLGLVRKVAEAHGGSVRCESSEGKGSKFSVLLPVPPIDPRR